MAAPRKHLSKAPAREALIDLQFEPPLSLAQIDQFVAEAAPSFQRKSDLIEATFGVGPDTPAAAESKVVGRRLDSEKTHFVLQSRLNGFTLSRLSPYGEWAELRGEAQRWWALLRSICGDRAITRVAVRYINAIAIPLPVLTFDEYFTSAPRVPSELPQGVSGFLQRVIVPDEAHGCIAVITQALEGQAATVEAGTSSAVTVLLDIDVSRATNIGLGSDDEVWAALNQLRDQKNRIFFAHLTEKAVEMFE